ncbi:MAG: Exodeoxyribonuclease, partial [Patescibacteria group bacterium]|nr:Exodeoxyribonuclease [Patescibacteria group bacterium]
SRWDLLDAMRMARALRPDGFHWPVDEEGRPVNKLAMLAAANQLKHTRAHDALSDVIALIGIAKHLRKSQPKFFDYLLKLRSKHEVAKLVDLDQPAPFVYTSGRYPKEFHHTTVAYPIAPGGKSGAMLVYDLRHDPATYAGMSAEDLAAIRFPSAEDRAKPGFKPFPAKELAPGNCPAVAPLATLNADAEARIGLTQATAQKHLQTLLASGLIAKLRTASKPREFAPLTDVDARLYDGFVGGPDKTQMAAVRTASAAGLALLTPRFADPRLPELFLRYKARNYPDALTDTERSGWEAYRAKRLTADLPKFAKDLEQAALDHPEATALLADLKLWVESIAPTE